MRTKGLFVTFHNNILVAETANKAWEYTKRMFAVRCNSLEEQHEIVYLLKQKDGIKNIRFAKSVDVSIFDVVEYKRYKMDNNFMWKKALPIAKNEVYEWCPYCECEVIIKADCSIRQVCPTCGKPIIACSMCETRDCNNCSLTKKTNLYVRKHA